MALKAGTFLKATHRTPSWRTEILPPFGISRCKDLKTQT
jgi:hypothetical protein